MLNQTADRGEYSSAEAKEKIAIANNLVEGVPPVFRLDALKFRRWICVAVEDELEGEAAMSLAKASKSHNFASAWSLEIPWTPRSSGQASYQIDLSSTAIQALTKEGMLGSCFVILEDKVRYAVVSDGDLYWMLAGPRDFVEEVLGGSLEAHFDKFNQSVKAYESSNSLAGDRLRAAQSVALAAWAVM